MTTDILAQPLHNCITRSGYQIQVWWHGNSAAFTSYKRANDELARLQCFEVPQQQALSLLDTLYNQYDAMAEQYEAMVQYIKTTFSLPKLNKVIDQLTADLLAVTECHPQMVQQAQAQATGETVADSEITAKVEPTSPLNPHMAAEYHRLGKMSLYELALVCPDAIKVLNGETVTLGEVTTEDEWPVVSISFDDDNFCHPDGLGDLWYAQPVQQAQAQAIGEPGLTLGEQFAKIVEMAEANGHAPAEYGEMYRRGLLTPDELFNLCPSLAPFKEWWQNLISKGFSRLASQLLRSISNGSISISDSDNEAYESGFATWLQDNCKWHNSRCGFEAYFIIESRPDSGLTLGDFVEADEPVASHPYPKRISPDSVTSSVEAGIYSLQCPADSHLAHTLESWRIAHTALPTLEAWGYVVAQDLKKDFGFWVTPKVLRKKISQTVEKLNSAKEHGVSALELPDGAANATDPALQVDYLNGLITHMEGLL